MPKYRATPSFSASIASSISMPCRDINAKHKSNNNGMANAARVSGTRLENRHPLAIAISSGILVTYALLMPNVANTVVASVKVRIKANRC